VDMDPDMDIDMHIHINEGKCCDIEYPWAQKPGQSKSE
jgi:major membrane immunogen (membrane-anchored lipoprotein)